jgi:hypothetical protein
MTRRALALSIAVSLVLCVGAAAAGTGISDEHACCRNDAQGSQVAPGYPTESSVVDCCAAPAIPAGAQHGFGAPAQAALPAQVVLACKAIVAIGHTRAETRTRAPSPPDRTTVLRL